MKKISMAVAKHLNNLSTKEGIISALAIDQRGSLKKALASAGNKPSDEQTIVDFKKVISSTLTPFASGILTDPEYGLPASELRNENCGLLLAYEKTGYDTTQPGRMPDLIANESALRLKEVGADAVKFLLYYDPDDEPEINDHKQAFVERVGAEAQANGLPFFLELLTYDRQNPSKDNLSFAKVKPRKVIQAEREFSKERYHVTVLKLEFPFNIKYLAGFNGDNPVAYNQEEAKKMLQKQSEVTDLPYIFLSAGVSSEEFIAEIKLAEAAHAQFNGVLCGRATWFPSVEKFAVEGERAGQTWLAQMGKQNIQNLNQALSGAQAWQKKLEVEE